MIVFPEFRQKPVLILIQATDVGQAYLSAMGMPGQRQIRPTVAVPRFKDIGLVG